MYMLGFFPIFSPIFEGPISDSVIFDCDYCNNLFVDGEGDIVRNI